MKILIELPTWLGDSVMSTPAIENIANNYPNARITLIGSKISLEALKNHPKVVKTNRGEPSTLAGFLLKSSRKQA